MGAKSNTWQKKSMAKAKRHWLRQNLGTCDRLSPRGFNHGEQTGIVDRKSKLQYGVPLDMPAPVGGWGVVRKVPKHSWRSGVAMVRA